MRVAIFGCLHGMLNEMYRAVERYESEAKQNIDFVIVCGDCQTIRHYDDLICLSVPQKYKRVGDFHEYYSGKKSVPKLTIFVGGNHEASNYLMTLPYGGWVCDNFYYLGYAGVIRYKGLRIAGVSGIYNYHNCNRGRFERMPLNDNSIRSIYHTRRLDVFRLQLLSKNAQDKDPIDVFMSHDWPAKVYNHGNLNQLLKFKPNFRADVESRDGLGSPITEPLLNDLKPRRWFAAHMHCKFYARVEHKNLGYSTEFLSLNKIEGGKRYMEVLDLSSDRDHNSSDGDLYYDAEWLTILRKTIDLENRSSNAVYCPKIDDDSGNEYFASDNEIQETIDMMESTGPGLKIECDFKMTEPVIYNRPDGEQPSIDHRREKFFANPQHEKLCNRLKLKSITSTGEPVSFVDSHTSKTNLDSYNDRDNNDYPNKKRAIYQIGTSK